MKNIQVTAIIGPMTSSQADFVIDLGNKEKVPVISQAASPSLSPYNNHYFIRSAHNSTLQLKPITELIKHFSWSEVVFMYEDGEYGRGLVPYLSDAMMNIGTKITYQTVIYPSVSDDWILAELYKLKTMQTRVFVVHALPDLASRLFKKVNEVGMMDEGYVWIITEGLTNQLHYLDHKEDLMQGVIGVKSYIPNSGELFDLKRRWKREFRSLYPDDDVTALDTSGIRLYDTVFGLAMALEKIQKEKGHSTADSDGSGALKRGSRLLQTIRNFRFNGLSGDFNVINGQLQSSVYEIVNIIGNGEKTIGFWSPEIDGISKKLSNETTGLKKVTWPGESDVVPKGWEIPVSNKNMLRVGVRVGGFDQFIDEHIDPETGQITMTGFCVDVFNAVVDELPYAFKYEFLPFVTSDGKKPAGSYDDLVFNLSAGAFPVGSPLVHDVSKAILQVTEKQMMNITNHWFKEDANCDQQLKGPQMKTEGFGLNSFKGVFLIAGLSSTSALLIFVLRFLYQNREMLVSQDHSVSQKLLVMAETFDVLRDNKSKTTIPKGAVHVESHNNSSPAISVFHQEAEVFSQDEEFSSTQPGSPLVLDTIQVVQTTTN
ncbi:putative periplasmic binding protein-like I [Helianthus annuus]|nr:putative periplasmic binding protein-like I [Helianthus annuus]KAJ0491949.1 putative periplasmic binding protein-like I [Helianthus annuus]